jgi:PAS domain S-box-containing protein
MPADPDAEILRLRRALRDLVALSAVPATWVEREPQAIAAGLADVLVGSLYLDFAFVRLRDPKGGAAVEVARGGAWKALPEWLQNHPAIAGQFSRREIIPDLGDGAKPCHGIIIPIGVNAEGGLVAAACGRADFPDEIDQLLLSVAANQAATAFRSASLAHELRKARNELEAKVAERTADLQRSETYLAEAQRLSHTGSFGWKVSSGAFYWSEETFRIFECDRANRPTVDLALRRTHPDDRAIVQRILDRAQQERKDFDFEHRLLMPDGFVKYLHVVAHASRDDESTVEFVGAVTDITERKRAEENLQRSEAYLAEAQRLSRAGSYALSLATREIVHWSEEMYRLYGFDLEEGIPPFEAVLQRIHPEDRDRVADEIEGAIRERTDYEVVFRVVLPDGTMKYIYGVGHPVFNAFGDLTEHIGTAMDVTERKRAEEERERLLASERAALAEAVAAQQRFRDLVNSVEGIVWEADAQTFAFSFVSEQAERILGYPLERWLSEPAFWKDHLHPEDRDWATEFCVKATAEKRDHDFEYRMIAADGSPVWLRDIVTVEVERDRATRVRGVMVDITKWKHAEQAMRQAQADLAHISRVTTMGELTASLAHELNQPIAAAVTNAKTCLRWLTRDQPDIEEACDAASRIVSDATRAADIISRIRLQFKKSAPQREWVDVNDVIREMIVLLRNEANRYSISIRTELTGDLPSVMADRVQLQQVFMNLMLNGIDAMKDMSPAGELTIRSRAEDGQLLISVSDAGVGLPPQVDQIFSAFFTTKLNGIGMGLTISRSIIESHGGRLWATANSGRGTTFHFTLPSDAEAS